ncbi:TPA: hypothetical protein N0F65_004218 [Lagenidium giganteum]|uniref:Uncharacterized protein n=1 Tax=Lagenidium giganteum TaxID=4803 RepID=A0AAV2ZDR3_9STRA|nr:TPA: hypothetical protein N0F65_004218 [Lagenidium giganteum]
MPLLFMDELPRDFKDNVDLAAIAALMDESCDDSDHDGVAGGLPVVQRGKKKRNDRRKQRAPYAKKQQTQTKHEEKRLRRETNGLQLCLTMFKM